MDASFPLVSVAMATYNGSRFLATQLESIVHQTYRNIEIVIVDDGSQDGTVEMVRDFQTRYPFIQLYCNDKNCGVTKTFERAVRYCKGYYVALSDQDDIWVPEKLETLVAEIGEHDAVYSDSLLVDENGRSLEKTFGSLMRLRSYYSGAPFLLSNTIAGHSLLVRNTFVQAILPFPDHLFFDLWIAFNAAAGNGIHYINKPLVRYRQHGGNAVGTHLSANKRKKDSVRQQFLQKRRILETLAQAPIRDQTTKEILREMLTLFHRRWSFKRSAFFFRHFNRILISKRKPHYRKVLYCMKMFFKPNF